MSYRYIYIYIYTCICCTYLYIYTLIYYITLSTRIVKMALDSRSQARFPLDPSANDSMWFVRFSSPETDLSLPKMTFWVVVSNIFYFYPYLGKIPILTNIFQVGWNHQTSFDFWSQYLEKDGSVETINWHIRFWHPPTWICFFPQTVW